MSTDDGNADYVTTSDSPDDAPTEQGRWARLSRWVSGHTKKLLGVIIVAVVGVVVQQVVTQLSAKKPPQPTQLHYTRLFHEDGTLVPPFRVSEQVKGAECIVPSQGSGDPNAWRCVSPDGYIRDPCWDRPWNAPGSRKMACIDSPWDHKATLLVAPKISQTPPESPLPYRRKTPWALQLRDPVEHNRSLHCVWVQGSGVQEIYGMRKNYYCWLKGHEWQDSHLVANAWGEVNTSRPLNTVAFTEAGSSEVRQAEVTDVWP
ncbi:hypothetical protein ACIP3A_39690 [Streptomyces tricolor]|uniref:hypothetical protein n=1 Tax=Streptomyces TaxID=1883 RepID=UPI001AD7E629|nr:hypothetical protein [Streptomyces sp. PBH53]